MPADIMSDPKVSIVIPLYNEEENVQPLQDEIERVFSGMDYELVLVDDGSKDKTVPQIRRSPRVRVLEFEKNVGQSAAMLAGILAARGQAIALLDGDLQNDPADVPKMMELLDQGWDLVCGYRAKRKDTAFKKFQSRVANAVRSRFVGDGVRDTGCTLKVMRKECREALFPFTGMHRFIPALIKGAGFRVTELQVSHRSRAHGVSKYGSGMGRWWRATRDMFGVQWLLQRRFQYRLKEGSGGSVQKESTPSSSAT